MTKGNPIQLVLLCAFSCTMLSQEVFYYFGHGLRGNNKQYLKPYLTGVFPEEATVLSINGCDHTQEEPAHTLNTLPLWQRVPARIRREMVLLRALRRAVMGQAEDQKRVLDTIASQGLRTEDCIYIGHSKGAALGANLLHNNQFKGAILLTPFCDANLAFRDYPPLSSLPHIPFIDNYFVPFLRYFLLARYNRRGQQPLHFTEDSPKTPVLIVSVKGDTSVPQYHQFKLYIKLKEMGYDVYFYEIKSGNHNTLAWNDQHAHQEFVAALQAFQNYVINGVTSDLYSSPSVEDMQRHLATRPMRMAC
jgi:predicted esterase